MMVQDSVLQHIHKRKRIHVKHELYPHSKKWKRALDKLMCVIAFIGPVMTLPQIIKIWVEKNAAGVSAVSWSTFAVLSVFWMVYGFAHKDKPIIISSVLWLVLDAFVVAGTLVYS